MRQRVITTGYKQVSLVSMVAFEIFGGGEAWGCKLILDVLIIVLDWVPVVKFDWVELDLARSLNVLPSYEKS